MSPNTIATRKMLEEFSQMFESQTGTAGHDEDFTDWASKSVAVSSISKIPGDASTRKYYRVTARPGSPVSSFILARVEPFADQKDNYPFLVVREHLEKSGVDVPKVYDADAEKGLVLQEDLGDVTLLRRLQEVCTVDVERHLYQKVLDNLIQLQLKASPTKSSPDLQAFKLFFDHEKLMWEVNFTIEHFYQKHLGRQIRDEDMKIIQDGFSEICHFLAAQPTVLTHRDFHSRNVMVTPNGTPGNERLVMIDFQDARMGPAQYDLVSLLRDSYYQLEEAQIATLLDYYIIRWEALSGQSLSRRDFIYAFDMMALQRNFKAIGSFASFLNRRGNPTYLKYIGNTFENIRRTLLKYPKYSALREALFHYYYF
jgi:hypothetical protein